jgi:molybdate transport system substrate-binding protein
MVKKLLLFLMLTLSLLSASEITIAVAANLSYAIDALKTAFEKAHPKTSVRVILGSSGKLSAQIQNGAPYGLFMSADMAYPQALYQSELAVEKPRRYARGTLALFSLKPHDFSQGMQVLNSDAIKRIAIANPRTAPYGKAAVEALQKSGLYDKVKPKLIYGESISQTVAYASTAADIGLIAASSLHSPHMKQYAEKSHWTLVDPKYYTPIDQGVVLLKRSIEDTQYRAFYDFLFSPEAQRIFHSYGYLK